MATERCPACGAVVRAGDPWCTLCWTDLRPKPEPPPPPPPPPPVPQPVAVAAPAAAPAVATVDPLTAPLADVLGGTLAADPGAPEPTWPCVECGAANALDLDRCGTCLTPFGGRVERVADPKAMRRKVMLLSFAGVGMFLLLLATITVATTKTAPKPPPASPAPVVAGQP